MTPAGSVSVTVTLLASDGPRFATSSWYETVPPAAAVAGPDFVTDRSAEAFTSVVAEALLLVGSGSDVVDAIATVFVSVVAWAGAVTMIVNVVLDPVFQVARVQVTEMLRLLLQPQPPLDGVTDTKLTPAGSVSVTLTLLAFDGPRLVATTV